MNMNHEQLVPVQFPLLNLQADQLPPPDWDAVPHALDTLGQQVPRMAQVNVQTQLNALLNGMNQMINGINNLGGHITTLDGRITALDGRITTLDGRITTLDDRITAVDQRTARIEADLALLPIRMFNASASDTAPLAYPPPHVTGGALPLTKYHAHRITGVEAFAALQVLTAPNIPNTAAERIKYFHDYIGIRTPAL